MLRSLCQSVAGLRSESRLVTGLLIKAVRFNCTKRRVTARRFLLTLSIVHYGSVFSDNLPASHSIADNFGMRKMSAHIAARILATYIETSCSNTLVEFGCIKRLSLFSQDIHDNDFKTGALATVLRCRNMKIRVISGQRVMARFRLFFYQLCLTRKLSCEMIMALRMSKMPTRTAVKVHGLGVKPASFDLARVPPQRFFFGQSKRCAVPKGQPAKRAHWKGYKKALQVAAWVIVDRARSGVKSSTCFAKDSLSYLCRCQGTQGNGATH